MGKAGSATRVWLRSLSCAAVVVLLLAALRAPDNDVLGHNPPLAVANANSAGYLYPSYTSAQMRGVAFYRWGADTSTTALYRTLQADLPAMTAVGFNSVRLVSSWSSFEPMALPSAAYSTTAFTNLRAILSLLKADHMRAILGLNYLGNGWGAPSGISYCAYMTAPDQYHAFVQYVATYLQNILAYAGSVTILLFDENALPCGMNEQRDAPAVAAALRPTLGNLPMQLPARLRSQFSIGFQDNGLISLDWARGASPLASPLSYDFVGMDFYNPQRPDEDAHRDNYDTYGCDLSAMSACVQGKLAKRAQRFQALYPGAPLIVGEGGATYCDTDQQPTQQQAQAAIEQTMARAIRQAGFGDAVWGWESGPPGQDCDPSTSYGGLAITNPDGTLNAAGLALQRFYHAAPSIASAGMTTYNNGRSIWVTGTNVAPTVVARLTDAGGVSWGGDIRITYGSSFSSFTVPSNKAPPGCKAHAPCTITLRMFDTVSGISSAPVTLTFPAV